MAPKLPAGKPADNVEYDPSETTKDASNGVSLESETEQAPKNSTPTAAKAPALSDGPRKQGDRFLPAEYKTLRGNIRRDN